MKTLSDYDKRSSTDLTRIIVNFIKTKKISDVLSTTHDWRFGDIQDAKEFIFCRLGKIRKVKKKTIYDEKTKSFKDIDSDDEDVFISHIFFDKKGHFFLFEERPELGYKELMHIIKESVKKFYDKEISIDILPNKFEISGILKRAHRITRASFMLKPSNPDNSEDLKKMDDLIRDVKAKKAKVEFNNDEGLNTKSSTFNSALSLSNRGFGDYNIDYEFTDGKKHKYYSKKKQLKETIRKPKSEAEWKNKMKEMFQKMIDLLDKNG